LEINLYYVPNDFELMGRAIIQEKLDIVEAVIKAVNIPVAIKLSPFYTNPLYVIKEMDKLGADAFVLFNKLFQPEVDIKSEKMIFPDNLSCPDEHNLPLRYTGLVYGNINADICASRGIFSAENAIAMILAGANTVQTVSSIYKHGCGKIEEIIKGIDFWMDQKGYNTIDDFRGKLSRKNIEDPMVYRRAQYVDILLHG
jgi:dihydroorotate dehydrogenase (fumarate)